MTKRLAIFTVFTLLTAGAFAQQSGSCLIVKHKGTIGRRLIWTALIGVPIAPGANYDYVDSMNLPGFKMSYKGKQLEQLRSSGTHVVVVGKEDAVVTAVACGMERSVPTPIPATTPATKPQVVRRERTCLEEMTYADGSSICTEWAEKQ